MGIFFGTIARSMPQLCLLIILVLIPLQILSSGTTPRESMSELVQQIMSVAPTTIENAQSKAINAYNSASSVKNQLQAPVNAPSAN